MQIERQALELLVQDLRRHVLNSDTRSVLSRLLLFELMYLSGKNKDEYEEG